MSKTWPFKDPDEILDYTIDWTPRLGTGGDVIVSSTWISPTGITVVIDSFTDTHTTIWLSGGSLAATYSFVNRITTAGGRTMDQTVRLKIKTK